VRYERRSLAITANRAFGDWHKVFPDKAVMLAVIDRLVHHGIIFEMNVESRRWEEALERQQKGELPVPRAAKKKG
jgi:DNA replication protein DnaC